jgi:hypothetical protein
MELTSLYCVKQRKFLPNSKVAPSQTHIIIVIYQIYYYFPKYVYILFPLQVCALNA